ncbi:MAG TPA: alpha-2-macroglobulin, partial [Chitinophagales bacterium]|nr:alpha-2-macroglobulin [Chitinophagales bacterium]
KSVEALKVWLLKQKQTNDWKTTRATAEACYALLLTGDNWLQQSADIDINIGTQNLNPATMPDLKAEAGTGYFKKSWQPAQIQSEMGNVRITKKDKGVSWGALYWQYFEQLDKITFAETPLRIKKQLFLQKNTKTGVELQTINEKTRLKVGDLVTVRVEIRVDREMEYVHLKDMRAAGFEPVNVISTYKYQDGLGYYETTKDAATNFFMSSLPKGTYVFEYPLRASQKGNFSNGITTMQCMYAPEFTSHSEGIRVQIEE